MGTISARCARSVSSRVRQSRPGRSGPGDRRTRIGNKEDDCWEDAYWGQFTYGSGGEGERPLVVSYASSSPVEVYFAEEPFEEAPTGVVVGDGSCFRQIEFAGILKGTPNRDLAEAWVDHMLGLPFQEDIPLHMFMFPANEEASLPQVFADFAVIPDHPAEVAYTAIEDNREVWINAWTEVVVH